MENIGKIRLYGMRAMYLFIVVGLALTALPEVVTSSRKTSDSHTVVNAILVGFCLMALLGVRYPLAMLPILLIELIWKTIWLLAIALPMHLNQGLDQYARDVSLACIVGLVVTPLAIPWRYVINHYALAEGNAWR